jgi:hypothetical protein
VEGVDVKGVNGVEGTPFLLEDEVEGVEEVDGVEEVEELILYNIFFKN